MPTIDYSGSIDFEVFCSECGEGICNNSDMDTRRGKLYVSCPVCKKAFSDVEQSLESEKKDLETENDQLRDEIYNLETEIKTLKQEILKYQ